MEYQWPPSTIETLNVICLLSKKKVPVLSEPSNVFPRHIVSRRVGRSGGQRREGRARRGRVQQQGRNAEEGRCGRAHDVEASSREQSREHYRGRPEDRLIKGSVWGKNCMETVTIPVPCIHDLMIDACPMNGIEPQHVAPMIDGPLRNLYPLFNPARAEP